MEEAREEVEFLVRSDCRVGVLETLSDGGTATRRELQEELDVVRTTIQRNLDALEERNLVRSVEGGYEITLAGKLVAVDLLETVETTALAIEAGSVLGRVGESSLEFDFDPRALTDATVVEATVADPYAPIDRYESAVADADHARLILPPTAANPLETTTAAIEDDGVHEVIVVADLVPAAGAERVGGYLDATAEEATVDLYRYDGELGCYLGILDDRVHLGVHDPKGIPDALLESTNDEVREWAIAEYERYREAAERIA